MAKPRESYVRVYTTNIGGVIYADEKNRVLACPDRPGARPVSLGNPPANEHSLSPEPCTVFYKPGTKVTLGFEQDVTIAMPTQVRISGANLITRKQFNAAQKEEKRQGNEYLTAHGRIESDYYQELGRLLAPLTERIFKIEETRKEAASKIPKHSTLNDIIAKTIRERSIPPTAKR